MNRPNLLKINLKKKGHLNIIHKRRYFWGDGIPALKGS